MAKTKAKRAAKRAKTPAKVKAAKSTKPAKAAAPPKVQGSARALAFIAAAATPLKKLQLERHLRRLLDAGGTLEAAPLATLQSVVRGNGLPALTALLGLDDDAAVRAKLGKPAQNQRARRAARPAGSAEQPADVVRRLAAEARELRDDSLETVRLDSLDIGRAFKTPDAPRENISGQYGVLLYATANRARVRLSRGARMVEWTNADGSKRSREIDDIRSMDWSPGTMVVPLSLGAAEQVL